MTPEAAAASAPSSGGWRRAVIVVSGVVQGVGFRYWTRGVGADLGLTGRVRNLRDGTVEIVAEGPPDVLQALLDRLRSSRTPGRVAAAEATFTDATGEFTGFGIA